MWIIPYILCSSMFVYVFGQQASMLPLLLLRLSILLFLNSLVFAFLKGGVKYHPPYLDYTKSVLIS